MNTDNYELKTLYEKDDFTIKYNYAGNIHVFDGIESLRCDVREVDNATSFY